MSDFSIEQMNKADAPGNKIVVDKRRDDDPECRGDQKCSAGGVLARRRGMPG